MPAYLDFIQPGRVGDKGALDANAVRRKASYGDALGRAVAAQTHDHALEWLQTLAVAFDNAIQHPDRIAWAQGRKSAASASGHPGQRSNNVLHHKIPFTIQSDSQKL